MPTVVGLDPSLTGFGVASFRERRIGAATVRSELWADVCGWARPARRRRLMLPLIPWLAGERGTVLAVMEARIPPTKGWQSTLDRAEMRATVEDWLFAKGIPIAYIEPGKLKKYATGKGNADKPQMLRAARDAVGLALTLDDDNQADALWLMLAGVQHYGLAGGDVFANVDVHALDAVDWPLWTQVPEREVLKDARDR